MLKPTPGKYPQVRIAAEIDAQEITHLINSAFRLAEGFFIDSDRIDLKEVIESLGVGKFLVAEEAGLIIGCVHVQPRGERAYLGLLSVDPSRQHSGVGSQLMTAAENYCLGLGCRFMDIKIVSLRKELPDFYRKRGYVETGTSRFPAEVKTSQPCHFIHMAKPISQHGVVKPKS